MFEGPAPRMTGFAAGFLQQQQQQITIKIMMKTMPPMTPPIIAPRMLVPVLTAEPKLLKALFKSGV